MRIGIVTFHRAVNYGAVLQAYALQKKLESYGNQVDIIDYRCGKIEEEVSPLDGFRKKIGFSDSMKKMVFRILKNKNFTKFYKNYLSMSTPCYTQDDLKKVSIPVRVKISGL